ncbi:MAG: STM4011 family radical SAM protein [Planctomycetales bacterium]
MKLTVMYRGPLSSCNYACGYCPFSKRQESPEQRRRDQLALRRFMAWISRQTDIQWQVLFTPWGEALTRRWYRQAIVELSHLPHVEQVAVQTNLSCRLDWLRECRASRVALWGAYHPTECRVSAFVRKVVTAVETGALVTAGAVGIPEHRPAIERLHAQLPSQVKRWINAQQPRPRPYSHEELAFFRAIDPQFDLTLHRQASLGRFCLAGETVFTVDGAGEMRRCHFVSEVIGNIASDSWRSVLQPRPCPRRSCHCYLGLAQLLGQASDASGNRFPFQRLVPASPPSR